MRDEVCVIGAGGAGLATGQALAARGIPFRIVEARDAIGGMWRHGETFAYDSLESNTSRYRTAFRSHRMRLRGGAFIPHKEFLGYLESFADRFSLRERVELGARVERVERNGDGWSVTITGREPEPFRAVVVATGVLGRPRLREVPGTFTGRRLHSGEYRSPREYAGQDVVVAGMGSSGAEIAGELVEHARSVTLAVRTGTWVLPKHMLPRVPFDINDTRLNARLVSWAGRRFVVDRSSRVLAWKPGSHGLPAPTHRALDEPVTMSDTFVRAMRQGRIAVRPGIARFDGDRVAFDDGSDLRADAVIAASGFDPDLSPLPEDLVGGYGYNHMPLFRGVAHPEADGLFFVGFIVGQGPLLPIFEAQARWLAAVVAGEIGLPHPLERRELLQAESRWTHRDFGRPFTVWRDRQRYIMWLERETRRAIRARASSARAA
jgi:cation diffusion facilitator CzcD-associated flavoprotein CzcO